MTTDQVPSLEPWLGALREDVEPMSETARYRVASRLASTALIASAGVAASKTAGLLRPGLLHSRLFAVALSLPVGALVGAAGHAHWQRQAAPPVTVAAAPVISTVAAPPSVAEMVEVPTMPPTAVEAAPAVASPPKRPPASPSVKAAGEAPSLELELSLLERARTALSEGQPQGTLRLLGEHRLAYPSSALQQEREALTIRALMAVGRGAEARARAARFVEAYPTSALRGSVDRAVGSIP
jgi:hypothetical protein